MASFYLDSRKGKKNNTNNEVLTQIRSVHLSYFPSNTGVFIISKNQIWYNFLSIITKVIYYSYPRFWGCFTHPQFFPLTPFLLSRSHSFSPQALFWREITYTALPKSAAPLTTLLQYLTHFCSLNFSSPTIKLQLGPGQNYFTQKISNFFSNHFLSCLLLFYALTLTCSLPS